MAKTKIFILDDDHDFCEELSLLLKEQGKVSFFTAPEDMLAQLDTERPDLLLLDMDLGDEKMNGLDVLGKLKKRKDSHYISIIMISGMGDKATLEAAFKMGVHDYVFKPVLPSFLLPKVESTVFQSRSMIHTHALTGLPGIGLIESEFLRRAKTGKNFSVAYCDLDHFKPFNDEKGVKSGDRAIEVLSEVVRDIRGFFTRQQLFAGHLGGDDFFLIGNKQSVIKASKQIQSKFSHGISHLFNPTELERGWYLAMDRDGNTRRIPLLSLSIAVVNISGNKNITFEVLSQMAARVKKKAKKIDGNSLVQENIELPKEKENDLFKPPLKASKPSKKNKRI